MTKGRKEGREIMMKIARKINEIIRIGAGVYIITICAPLWGGMSGPWGRK
jgi:hypothetical protein